MTKLQIYLFWTKVPVKRVQWLPRWLLHKSEHFQNGSYFVSSFVISILQVSKPADKEHVVYTMIFYYFIYYYIILIISFIIIIYYLLLFIYHGKDPSDPNMWIWINLVCGMLE